MSHLFCFGLGYSAERVAQQLAQKGWRISGTSTRADGAARLEAKGYDAHVFNGASTASSISKALNDATHILLSIPPTAAGDPAYLLHGEDIVQSRSVKWIGYYSTVGVYGDAQGGWVDEDSEAKPMSERGQRRVLGEQQWLELGKRSGTCTNVLRLPGIYGPGRSAIDDVRAGTARAILKPGQIFNRIHVDDIASATIAAMAKADAGRVYNVTDDEPCPPQDVVFYAAGLLGAPPPPSLDFATADLSPMARSFYSESKRVSNKRMKSELAIQLKFPNFREGLTAIAKSTE